MEEYNSYDFISEPGLYMLFGAKEIGKTVLALNFMYQRLVSYPEKNALFFYSNPLPVEENEEIIHGRMQLLDTEWLAGGSQEGLFLQAKWAMQDNDLGMIIVDDFYELLRKTSFDHIEPTRKERVAYLLTRFKTLAELYDIPVILVADTEEYIDGKKDKHPRLEDLRDKKLIREFVDKAILMYVDEKYDPDTELKGITELELCDLKSGTKQDSRLAYISNNHMYCVMGEKPTNEKERNKELDEIKEKATELIEGREKLIERYTFETFAVDEDNKAAYAGAEAVATFTSKGSNPLYIYGPEGTGKTHLLHAIGNTMRDMNPELNIMYVTAEHFLDEVIGVIRSRSLELSQSFRDKYRKIDVLLFDDIDKITDKDATSEELFDIINHMLLEDKQVVVSAQVKPQKLTGENNDDRISKLSGGLVVKTDYAVFDLSI